MINLFMMISRTTDKGFLFFQNHLYQFLLAVPRPPKIDPSNVKEIFVKRGELIEVKIPFDGKLLLFLVAISCPA